MKTSMTMIFELAAVIIHLLIYLDRGFDPPVHS